TRHPGADSTGRHTSIVEVLMTGPADWMKELTGRAPMKSPGRPRHDRSGGADPGRCRAGQVTLAPARR
ncbi:MAG: hypothetical protein ACRDTU_22405, partial [Micromonosporaceae bacterium]